MNVCVAHLQMNACVAKNFGAWTEKVGHPCPTFMAHPTRVGRRVGALHKKLGHPCSNGMCSQFHVLHIGYFSPSDFQLQAVRDHGREKS